MEKTLQTVVITVLVMLILGLAFLGNMPRWFNFQVAYLGGVACVEGEGGWRGNARLQKSGRSAEVFLMESLAGQPQKGETVRLTVNSVSFVGQITDYQQSTTKDDKMIVTFHVEPEVLTKSRFAENIVPVPPAEKK